MNREIITALTTIGLAQALKVPLNESDNGESKWNTLLKSGKMPSSHSAGVTALSTYVGLDKGFTSVDFALATIFGLIVMYDAQGIRRQTGELTLKVNDLDEEIEKLEGYEPGDYHREREDKLKEMLGHQPEEVVAGALLGILSGSISYVLTKR
ncbi:divergent PAP2 family protein [Desertibacillus haloalkaliphilus]|uniref:divergent PAP2 family protein n=1 Tax=Desertibacillus haloalkaliphilus TaxID=1328930 RepID=UPI001C278FDD|nr:divergent PAP2 family protein [Desertibacillus haloalkaliphilus]MBU8907405.1 divergent PAP2 family protein [Desertibacillus haloalkaliphilus]